MSDILKPKLILISGSPCVGKSTVAEALFYSYENSAHLDDDWVWRVHPFSFSDPRNPNVYKNMAFVLSTYLNSDFAYVFVSSVRMISKIGRDTVLREITAENFSTVGFTLTCSEETLTARHKARGDQGEVSFKWLHMEPCPGDFVMDTDGKTIAQIVNEMRSLIG